MKPLPKKDKNKSSKADVVQHGEQFSFMEQENNEMIWIKESCNVHVHTTDTKAAVSLQVGLQLAITLVVSITIGDTDRGQAVVQEIVQKFDVEQSNRQKVYIKNSKDVNVTTTDTDLAENFIHQTNYIGGFKKSLHIREHNTSKNSTLKVA